MGVDISLYRFRIGVFSCSRYTGRLKARIQQCNQYNFHSVFVAFLLLSSAIAISHHFTNSKETNKSIIISSCVSQAYPERLIPMMAMYSNKMQCGLCSERSVSYVSYHQLLLLLSSDVELNPGPGPIPGRVPNPETQVILDAIAHSNWNTNQELLQVKNELTALRQETGCLRKEIKDVSSRLCKIESKQKAIDADMTNLASKVDSLEQEQHMLQSDFNELGHMCDRESSDQQEISKRLDNLEAESVKTSLRIFGLDDDEFETNEHTLDKYVKYIHKVAFGETAFDQCEINSIRRIGQFVHDRSRMVLVNFKNFKTKLTVLQSRDKFRDNGIRLSNELTSHQRAKLKALSRNGITGYYKNGILYKREQRRYAQNSRVFKRATRRNDIPEPESNGTDLVQMETDLNRTASGGSSHGFGSPKPSDDRLQAVGTDTSEATVEA